MKESEDKHIKQMIDNVMKQATLETPQFDFTSVVMEKVEAIKKSASTTYEPLISTRAWFGVISAFIVFVVGVFWFGTTESSELSNTLDFGFVNKFQFSEIFYGLQLSNSTRVSILMFAVMLMIQIPLLKNYFDKRVLS